jgi:hypothetical protein
MDKEEGAIHNVHRGGKVASEISPSFIYSSFGLPKGILKGLLI